LKRVNLCAKGSREEANNTPYQAANNRPYSGRVVQQARGVSEGPTTYLGHVELDRTTQQGTRLISGRNFSQEQAILGVVQLQQRSAEIVGSYGA
jgi:hypothetical protein